MQQDLHDDAHCRCSAYTLLYCIGICRDMLSCGTPHQARHACMVLVHSPLSMNRVGPPLGPTSCRWMQIMACSQESCAGPPSAVPYQPNRNLDNHAYAT
jgi:hypothetical protein